MTNEEIMKIALAQSGFDMNCKAEDFLKSENVVVYSKEDDRARKYLKLPFSCNLVSYGNNVVASVNEDTEDIVREYINKYPIEHLFETPNMHVLNEKLLKKGLKICFMAEYFLPDATNLKRLDCGYELRMLERTDFEDLYKPEWSNALCEKRKYLDVLAIGAYDKGKLIALAGASCDCEDMWQIGVDVLPEYRKRGIASSVTSNLAAEIMERGKVPFYCAAWCNIKSVKNAIKCSFKPAWVEMTVKESEYVDEMNKEK
ncbi:MAG: GNAT family N-acetyltransferase [Clostridia bacterium]|nr:GNAT family N-acetyltransferase [Clostridia bacterium]